jgi:glutathione S-transferase
MKLYNSLGPNPHTVRMFAVEKEIDLPLQEIDVMGGEHRRPPYSDFNPMMQTPAFQADDGQVIVELTAICEYLEELHPNPPLIGATPGERAETRMWVRRIDLNILEGRSRAGRATAGRAFYIDKIKLLSVEAAKELAALVEDRILWLDEQMAGKTYLCGDRYTLADIMLY